MGHKSPIEWTDATWNPITGCTLVSDGCKHCYAAMLAAGRLKNIKSRTGLAKKNAAGVAQFTGKLSFNEEWINQPTSWQKPRLIFVCAHGDLFHESAPTFWIDAVFDQMEANPRHTFQVLTKRPERMKFYFSDKQKEGRWPLPNVWVGTSVEDQKTADERIPHLLEIQGPVRFISAEPLLGPVCISGWNLLLDWVIVGGESGHLKTDFNRPRPMHPDWVRTIRDQCIRAKVPFLFKQWGNWKTVYDRDRDDPDWRNCPKAESNDERYLNIEGGHGFHGDRVLFVRNVGKANAGRLLDGRTWDEMP